MLGNNYLGCIGLHRNIGPLLLGICFLPLPLPLPLPYLFSASSYSGRRSPSLLSFYGGLDPLSDSTAPDCFWVLVMDEGRQKDLQLLEEIIDKGLKQKLVHATASRDKIFEEQKVLSDLRKNLETLEQNAVNSLKTMVNLGSEIYMQAQVPDTRHIFIDVGLGFYVEFTRQEALDYISQREQRIKNQSEEVTGVITQIKGRIKLAHYQIQQILNLPEENPSSSRPRTF